MRICKRNFGGAQISWVGLGMKNISGIEWGEAMKRMERGMRSLKRIM